MMGTADGTRSKRCPVCGEGRLVDITYREGEQPSDAEEPVQTAASHQVETYSCGHERTGPRLDATAAGTDALQAERRRSEDAAEQP